MLGCRRRAGCQLYLGEEAVDATIICSKSSECNVSTPASNPEEDQVEAALPEQFSSVMVITIVAHLFERIPVGCSSVSIMALTAMGRLRWMGSGLQHL